MADDLAARLLPLLEAEEGVYLEMRDALQHERVCLANLDAEGLESAVRRKQTLAAEARVIEESRAALVAALAESLEMSQPTLSQLADRLGAEAPGLREAHARLVALLGAVRELLDANAAFAGESLAQVRATLQLLGRLSPEQPTYGPGAGEGGSPGRLVSRSA